MKLPLWLKLWRYFIPTDLTRDEAWQLAVLLNTPGFTREHHEALFDWEPRRMRPRVKQVLDYFKDTPSVLQGAQNNAASITQADGLAWLKAVINVRPHYHGTVPLWTKFALNGLPHNAEEVADLLNLHNSMGIAKTTASGLVRRWRTQEVFDPLTGLEIRND